MRQSKLFTKTLRQAAQGEVSINAKLLTRAGFIHRQLAGVYSYLPLGLRVLEKIKAIVRQEMNAIGGQEILMPALQSKELWQETGRWDGLKDIMFQFEGREGKAMGLGVSHEEVGVDIARQYVKSYRDLPFALYQIQDKFRNEPRAKSGLLRGREFSMKDLYSFHADEEDLRDFYGQVIKAYQKIFQRLGLKSIVTEASGGVFSKEHSHEFQVATENGEDKIVVCGKCAFAQNTEISELPDGGKCPECRGRVSIVKSIEVGNIFMLGVKYSHDMKLSFADEDGKVKEVVMGCYGFGPSRVMGSVVEISHDDKGIVWPREITPFEAQLLLLDESKKKEADRLYRQLTEAGFGVLYDDRIESAGIKLNDADLIGITVQLIIGSKTEKGVEFRLRDRSFEKEIKYDKVEEELARIYHV